MIQGLEGPCGALLVRDIVLREEKFGVVGRKMCWRRMNGNQQKKILLKSISYQLRTKIKHTCEYVPIGNAAGEQLLLWCSSSLLLRMMKLNHETYVICKRNHTLRQLGSDKYNRIFFNYFFFEYMNTSGRSTPSPSHRSARDARYCD